MSKVVTAEREQFEKWATGRFALTFERGQYIHERSREAWAAWQAAYALGVRQQREEDAQLVCGGCAKGYKYQDGSHQIPDGTWEGSWFECKAAEIRKRGVVSSEESKPANFKEGR